MNKTRKAALKKSRKNKARKKNARLFENLDSYSEIKKLALAGDENAQAVLCASRNNRFFKNVRLFQKFVDGRKNDFSI